MSVPPFTLPPALWAALQQAGLEMGVPAAQLVNQAVFSWATLHGYLAPSPVEVPTPSDAEVARLSYAALERRPPRPDAPLPPQDAPPVPEPEPETARVPVVEEPEPEWLVRSAANIEPYEPTSPGGQKVRLVVLCVNGRDVPVDAERFIIGRDVSCNLTIDSGRISRQHAVVVLQGDAVLLEDLRSSNGTWHGGQRVERATLAHGDEVYLGDTLLRVEFR